MTQVDSSAVRQLGTPLDHLPTQGHGQAAAIDATTPLPDGWGSFCSKPDTRYSREPGRWYASAPWHVDTVRDQAGDADKDLAAKLEQTVDAPTWVALHGKVAAQVALYRALTGGEAL